MLLIKVYDTDVIQLNNILVLVLVIVQFGDSCLCLYLATQDFSQLNNIIICDLACYIGT